MTTANDVRRAHDLLDGIINGHILGSKDVDHLRSFLPERPKQKTLEEITIHVLDAWSCTSDNDWGGDGFDPDITIEDWLGELHAQLQGLKDAPANTPALPDGMRLADHEEIGRVVVSPATDSNGERMIFCLDKTSLTGAGRRWAHEASLTFIDAAPAAPAKPTHPEFLETEADYESAPEGTIVARDGENPCHKLHDKWLSFSFFDVKDDRGMSRSIRQILRWGWGND